MPSGAEWQRQNFDGNSSFAGGQDSGRLPESIRQDQFARGINVTTRLGALSPRLRYIETPLEWVDPAHKKKYYQSFRGGKFQGAFVYNSTVGDHIIAIKGGVIFQIDPLTQLVSVLELPDRADGVPDRLNEYRRRVSGTIAGRFLVLFDLPQNAVIIDGGKARRSNSDRIDARYSTDNGTATAYVAVPELPPARIGTFVQSRLWVGSLVHEFGAGDPVGGINADAPITFEESLVQGSPYNGQFFSLGGSNTSNPISYMGSLQQNDTSTGYGPLLVATRDHIYTYAANLPRADWAPLGDAGQFGSLALSNAGIIGPKAAVNVNNDLLFMSGDMGIRSLSTGRDEQRRWGNSPISNEVSNWLLSGEPDVAEMTCAAVFGGRAFFTASPYRTIARDSHGKLVPDYAFRGFVVLELQNASSMFQTVQPAWAGIWTGACPTEIVAGTFGGQSRCYFFAKEPTGMNLLYQMSDAVDCDWYRGAFRQVKSRIYSRGMFFESPLTDKQEVAMDLALSDMSGGVSLVVDRRPGHLPNFALWKKWAMNARVRACKGPPISGTKISVRQLDLGTPEDTPCDPVSGDKTSVFRHLQVRLSISGDTWRINNFRLRAKTMDDAGNSNQATSCKDSEEPQTVLAQPSENDLLLSSHFQP